MSRLTELSKRGKADQKTVGPHQFRRLGEAVLVVDDAGRFAFLSPTEYGEYLSGLKRSAPLRKKLLGAGLLRDAYDFDEAAQFVAEKSLLSWPGPSTHLLRLGRTSTLELVKKAVDFAFSAPGPEVRLELQPEKLDRDWSLVWFAVQYARRQGEWRKRPVGPVLRVDRAPAAARREFLEGHRVELRAVFDLSASTRIAIPGARRAAARVTREAKGSGAAWVEAMAEAGIESVLLESEVGPGEFLQFYTDALDCMLQLQGRLDIREERALGLLSGRRWLLPGHDVLSELCYTPDGAICSSGLAADLGNDARAMLKLGELGVTRFEDLAASPAVKAVLAASLAENQPLCSQCAYRPFCSIPPSENLRAQGTLWGRHPASERCSLHMAILDVLFARLAKTETAEAMRQWLG